MSQLELLRLVLEALNAVGAESMLFGSHAAAFHGEVRSTPDVDLVVDLPEEQTSSFIARFDRHRFYLSESAFAERRMANVIDTFTGDKVDLFFLQTDAEAQREFRRRVRGEIMGIEVDVMTVEDTIVSKLRWDAKIGGSELQRQDILGLVATCRDSIDWDYVWANIDGDIRETLQMIVRAEENGR
ncbi:MAG: hypothetical protein AAFU85_10220 [Planctomycetota bacterium]